MRLFNPILILLLIILYVSVAEAQVSTRRVRERVNEITNVVENNDTDQVLFVMIDYVTRDGSATQSLHLSSDNRYRVIAIGDDNRIRDIDLYVLNEYGSEVAKDPDDKNIAACTFRPASSGIYKFKVKPYKMLEEVKDGFFGLIVSRIR
ncbi:hypothetical protein [Spirosoma sp.]|uniref:hypothetical protein n=1 Tax=Spirosoma sp. TaxID=1899569 RepID=UPI00261D8F88|nr:hypothetical protein [Spirosoma sp.]MCX6212829.1 hypothetical protein [Spirosoma sp.]